MSIGITRATGDLMGTVGTIMNGLAMADFIIQNGAPAIVLSAIEIPRVCDFFRRSAALHHFEQGRVVICVAGTGNPYFSTDTGAVQRALEMDCDMVIKATGQAKQARFYSLIDHLTTDSKLRVIVDAETNQSSNPKYFAGGDAINGGAEVVNGAYEGKKAAKGIHKYLNK